MDKRMDQAKEILQPQARVAGQIMGEEGEVVTVRMGGYLLDIPRSSILNEEKDGEKAVILTLRSDAEILMTTVTPVDKMIGVLSRKIIKGMVNPFDDCCDCYECSYCTDCTECSYCTDCTQCSDCIESRPWTIRAMEMIRRRRLGSYRRF